MVEINSSICQVAAIPQLSSLIIIYNFELQLLNIKNVYFVYELIYRGTYISVRLFAVMSMFYGFFTQNVLPIETILWITTVT